MYDKAIKILRLVVASSWVFYLTNTEVALDGYNG
jgi:hypothetical protein